MSSSHPRRGLVGPALLIGLGILFLLENLDILAWNVWEAVLRLWPLLLIAWGLELLLGRRSAWGAAFALILTLALLVGGAFILGDSQLQTETTRIDFNIPLAATQHARIRFDPALAYLRVRNTEDDSESLLEGYAHPLPGEEIDQEITQAGRRLEATIRTSTGIVMPFLHVSTDRNSWDFRLHPEVAYDLSLKVGAGKTDLFLEPMVMERIDVDTGIGQTIIRLPATGNYEALIKGGLGQVIVILPDDVGIKLLANVGIGAVDVPKDYRREGDAFVSPTYHQAEDTVELTVNMGIGSIDIR